VWQSLVKAFALPDLRNRMLYVLGMLAVFVLGCWMPVPGIDRSKMANLFSGNLLGLINTFSGGALQRFSIFAMGIMPYINASIIFQLLHIAVPAIEELSKEGEYGRRKISQYTRYLTVALAFVQGFGVTTWLKGMQVIPRSTSPLVMLKIVLTVTAGTAFLMWLGEQITDKGIGNGVSLIIFAGIVTDMPSYIRSTAELLRTGAIGFLNILLLLIIFVSTIAAIVCVQLGERRIPVRYGDRIAGRRVIRGVRTHLPIRINQAGVIPIIFAISVSLFPATVAQFLPNSIPLGGRVIDMAGVKQFVLDMFTPGQSAVAAILYALLVIGFTYFYTAVIFNPRDVADHLKKYGGQVQGFSPGLPTAQYLDRVMTRVTFGGALFLCVIALMQYYVPEWTRVTTFKGLVGGTSLLIMVGVALDTVQQIDQQLKLRQYEGFTS